MVSDTYDSASGQSSLWRVLVVLAVWAGIVIVLALNGFYEASPGEPPIRLLGAMVLTLTVFGLAYRGLPVFRSWVLGLDMRLLILLHSWRVLGLSFLFLYAFDHLPAAFAFSAGIGDALTGYGATLLAWYVLTRPDRVETRWIAWWNTFGLLDFIAAVSLALLSRQGAPLDVGNGITADVMTQLPMVLVPAFLVQVFVLIHLTIFLQLRNGRRP